MSDLSDSISLTQYSDEEKERHRIYCYLVMSLLAHYWNPWKKGVDGQYNWTGDLSATPSTYLGHNIACIAVDGNGKLLILTSIIMKYLTVPLSMPRHASCVVYFL